MAILLANGALRLVYSWIVSRSSVNGGSGNAPTPRLLEWPNQGAYQSDLANGNADSASYIGSDPLVGFDISHADDEQAIYAALVASGGEYAGATQL